MRPFAGIGVAFLLTFVQPAAAGVFPCGDAPQRHKAACGDPELMTLGGQVDAALKRLIAAADPLTAMLLKRDQERFTDLVGGGAIDNFDDDTMAERRHMIEALRGRLAKLARLRPGAVADGLVGEWDNVYGVAQITVSEDGPLQIKIVSRVMYPDGKRPHICALTALIQPTRGEWYAGTPGAPGGDDDADGDAEESAAVTAPPTPGNATRLRVRLQGNTLRIVVENGDGLCNGPSSLTGSYFSAGKPLPRTAAAAPPRAGTRLVAPSFDCAAAGSNDSQEICADPELAAGDAEIAKLYREALRRLDPGAAALLREDQRNWAQANATAYDRRLQPAADTASFYVHHTDDARAELARRLRERASMLGNRDVFPDSR